MFSGLYYVPLLLAGLYLSTLNLATITTRRLRRRRIGLVIAHPDDEAMFFAPTILQLAQKSWANRVYVLCLSNGNAEGLGATREKELEKSLEMMGVTRDSVRIVSDSALPDSMEAVWPVDKIMTRLTEAFVPDAAAKSKTPQGPNIDILITFDAHGVSNHPNHVSLLHGATEWCSAAKQKGHEVELYTLVSTSLWRKYLSFLDIFLTIVYIALNMAVVSLTRKPGSRTTPATKAKAKSKARTREDRGKGLPMLFVSTLWTWRLAQKTMTDAHVSQMRWFRWGWIVFSRYMVVNDLKAVSYK